MLGRLSDHQFTLGDAQHDISRLFQLVKTFLLSVQKRQKERDFNFNQLQEDNEKLSVEVSPFGP